MTFTIFPHPDGFERIIPKTTELYLCLGYNSVIFDCILSASKE